MQRMKLLPWAFLCCVKEQKFLILLFITGALLSPQWLGSGKAVTRVGTSNGTKE